MKCYLILVIEIGKVDLLRIQLSSSTRRNNFSSTFIPEDIFHARIFLISESSSNLQELTLFFSLKKIQYDKNVMFNEW